MNGAVILLLSFTCLAISVQCYGGRGIDPLGQLINLKRTEESEKYRSADVSAEYSPVYVENQKGLKEADRVISLPGQPEVSFSQYSGYVTVDPNAGRALFYYFAESQDSSTKPLVLWLNGGPGCSSLGAGAMTELGPFRVNPDGKTMWYNKNSWNNVANVIFLESPAGVGFSYSNKSSDYITGDKQTAADSYVFLINWLERFPEYKTRDFYITGESYAGHYVPQLADLILQNNKITNQTIVNLKGIAMGNAYIDAEDQLRGVYDYYWTHALISDEIHKGIIENCNFSLGASLSVACQDYAAQAKKAKGNVFSYDIYAPLCSPSSNAPPVSGYDPCSDNYVYAYLNTPQVQKALHANVTGILGPWDFCKYYFTISLHDTLSSASFPYTYHGDTDSVVPVTTTRYSMPKLGAPVKTPWYPWYNQGEVGGYAVEYENITFVSIRGAGHFVPSYQPERALTLFSSFLEGKLPPTAN
ncbi:hypothetical protein DH2020_023879 [Rehmannia glutinosa]|uniref:Carboxypeptidase n=1 Tax=Rehmannia glutinosa TaxID=99300 RepID=A0ABR0W9U3_REHGL